MTFYLDIEDREEVEEETKGNFDPDVASMRSKMAEPEEELEDKAPSIPTFKTPREIINEFRAFEQKAEDMAKSKSDGSEEDPMETDQGEKTGDGTKTGGNGKGDAQGGANDSFKKTDAKDNDDEMSIKSQE